jgi:hypothetical protein
MTHATASNRRAPAVLNILSLIWFDPCDAQIDDDINTVILPGNHVLGGDAQVQLPIALMLNLQNLLVHYQYPLPRAV